MRICAHIVRRNLNLPMCVYAYNRYSTCSMVFLQMRILQTPPMCVWSFCVYAKIFLFWSFCRRTQNSSACLLGTCVSMQMVKVWSFAYCLVLEFLQTYSKQLRISIRDLRINANGEHSEFLGICTDFLVLKVLQIYAKAAHL